MAFGLESGLNGIHAAGANEMLIYLAADGLREGRRRYGWNSRQRGALWSHVGLDLDGLESTCRYVDELTVAGHECLDVDMPSEV